MFRNSIILIIAAIGMSNCNNAQNITKTNTETNALLAKEVTVNNAIIIDNEETPDFTKGLNKISFLEKIYDIVYSGKIPVYGNTYFIDTLDLSEPFTPLEIKSRITNRVDTFDLDLINEIRFWEKWDFNINKCKLSKKTIGWTPIMVWKEEERTLKRMLFYCYPNNFDKGELIASNFIYEINWYYNNPTEYVGFDSGVFLANIITGLKQGTIDAYDPIYLIDKSKRKLSIKELEKEIGEGLNPVRLNIQINSILFEEDWYFDETTLGITKDVKSIAFVGWDHENDKKKILFFLFPKE